MTDYATDPTKVAVIIPTVRGRERYLERCLRETCPPWVESRDGIQFGITVVVDKPTCGEGWNSAVEQIKVMQVNPDYALFTADDVLPHHDDWATIAIRNVQEGFLPAPVMHNAEGVEQDRDGPGGAVVTFPRVPFLPWSLVLELFPIPALHYYSDVWIGKVAELRGWRTRVDDRFAFTHLWAQEGRITDDAGDAALFEREYAIAAATVRAKE